MTKASSSSRLRTTFAGVPGTYTASVTLPGPDWEGVTPTTISFDIDAEQDGCVQIRFKLRQIVPVTVYKIDADHNPLPNWTIDAVPGGGNLFAEPQSEETDVDGRCGVHADAWRLGLHGATARALTTRACSRIAFQPVVPKTGRMELDVQPLAEGDPDIHPGLQERVQGQRLYQHSQVRRLRTA